MQDDHYRIYAIKYAQLERSARENFIGGDIHDGPMKMDYFIWAVVGETRSFIVDTGFDEAMAAKRGRRILNPIKTGLLKIGLDPAAVKDVVITHMHYDHAGNNGLFPNATYHVQDREMRFCTGRCMCHPTLRHPFAVEDVTAMIERLYAGRVCFHDQEAELAPGISLHRTGGHSDGLQVVRVRTARGYVVLASDATHYYANIGRGLPFPIVYNVGDLLEGYQLVKRLADGPTHIIPGHDPQILKLFPPASEETQGWIARVDLPASGLPEF